MIDPHELRIGNWVLVEIAKSLGETEVRYRIEMVDSIFVDGINMEWNHEMSDYTRVEKVRPIPLTPEILERCGFETFNQDGYFGVEWRKRHTRINELVEYKFEFSNRGGDKEYRWLEGNINVPLQHLHELQNLYFALTGIELNYSPDK